MPGVTASLSPNPFSEQAVLDIRGRRLQQGMLNLYDAQGRLLRTQTMQNNQTLIERKDLPAGICFFLPGDGQRDCRGRDGQTRRRVIPIGLQTTC